MHAATPSVGQRRLNRLLFQLSPDAFLRAESCASSEVFVSPFTEERANASFPVRDMTYFLDGGQEMTEKIERIVSELKADPLFKNSDRYDLTQSQSRERCITKFKSLVRWFLEDPEDDSRLRMTIVSLLDPELNTRIGVHYGLFFGAVRGQATPEQLHHWIQEGMLTMNIVGCFAMTEMGHGSNVQGVETTATYDKSTQEFVIHSPTVTSTKWWIGGLASSATHAAVFAQLIIDGKKYGVKTFIVPLRNKETYEPLPGREIGDCGAKMGRHGIDNGWIRFHHVRIPRDNMLMKYTQVSPEGVVTEPPMQQLAYGALILGRVEIVKDSANFLKKAITIATRYAAVRRQFSTRPGEPERKIIDYTNHQYRLMPILATAYAMVFTGKRLNEIYTDLLALLESGDVEDALPALKETHATSSGLKAFFTWYVLAAIEECRQCCGGHGYSAYTGLSALYNDYAVQCTWEGDNTVLTQQTARYLLNCYKESKSGIRQPEGVGYLNELEQLLASKASVSTAKDLLNPDFQVEAFNYVAGRLMVKASRQLDELTKGGVDEAEAMVLSAVDLRFLAKAHCYSYVFRRFTEAVDSAPENLRGALTNVRGLFALYYMKENFSALLQHQYLTSAQADLIDREVLRLCNAVRRDAIPLIDAFNLDDFVINSPFGRYDGNIYEHYFEQVKAAPNSTGVAPYFESVIKPLINQSYD
eukprot:TRINITY_DN12636_c0_g1_i1.p1 TRINITY_DN12636_c0_g1~~TRINITY_DN12636_c0_g1_i1.p1  ORF type:complete len:700 (+),score=147.84 TRINITY_DN12636_c0_g1_i1:52-2151(+)